ncbi:MAG: hypothetical protein ACT4PM_00450 [Gemmatimonadales bacterium]
MAWTSEDRYLQGITLANPGHYPMYGATGSSASNLTGIQINLVNIPGPGTYPLGTGGGVSGGTASVSVGSVVWMTELSGAAGTVAISTLTATRAAGTFSFVAKGVGVTGASGTKTVTNGQFDFPITTTGTVGEVPEAAKSKVSAVLGGQAWNGATITAGGLANGLTILAGNTTLTIGITMVPFPGAGTYQLLANNFNRILTTPGTDPNALCCWGGMTGLVSGQIALLDTGTITVTSFGNGRIQGTFSATLVPKTGFAATTNLVMTSGTFDVGLP